MLKHLKYGIARRHTVQYALEKLMVDKGLNN